MPRVCTMLMKSLGLAAGLLLMPSAAWAHAGSGPHVHFASGFLHPLSGLDHLLAMIAVGLFAASLGGRALWAVPLSFLTLMVAGGVMGVAGLPLPFVEPAIALSVAVFGLALVMHRHWTVPAAMMLVGLFAVFHGYAHGTEIPQRAAAMPYVLGFVTATALLHGAGIAIGLKGLRAGEANGMRTARVGGVLIASAGFCLMLAAW